MTLEGRHVRSIIPIKAFYCAKSFESHNLDSDVFTQFFHCSTCYMYKVSNLSSKGHKFLGQQTQFFNTESCAKLSFSATHLNVGETSTEMQRIITRTVLTVWWADSCCPKRSLFLVLAFKISIIHPKDRISNVFTVKWILHCSHFSRTYGIQPPLPY